MRNRVHNSPLLIYSPGTQVVVARAALAANGRVAHPAGAVGVVVKAPVDRDHAYLVRFVDGFEAPFPHDQLVILAEYKQVSQAEPGEASRDLYDRVIYRCVIGSRAYGLDDDRSDTDRRGIYLPPAERHWSLFGVPEQLENEPTQEAYWELQKFLILALKANPNALECLYSPLVETVTPLAQELLDMRPAFLSRLVYQTFNGYVMSQFKKTQSDLRNQGNVKWKHVMHMLRLLLSGIATLREGTVPLRVDSQRDQLLAIKRGETPWDEIEAWRMDLHRQFDLAFAKTSLPERPDYERVNAFLIKARRLAMEESLP